MALAVTATMGTHARPHSESRARISRVAAQPSFTGMSQSMSMQAKSS
eukprot:CAMPEP_0196577042 /NCGR_PEP_ID=MMETSP1081-20130531/6189_1 /TAXON_ID=36882 /ORGANISM="Pyramimonas amylifera, Strain CCMP720" /LENGTH=46 /DNA_ID= /DNA_START= /DNA_END= /DNA_ORIENTATION=